MLRIFVCLQIMNIFFKMDEMVSNDWSEIFWPFWITFSIMIGLSFTILLILITKMCSLLCMDSDKSESKAQHP